MTPDDRPDLVVEDLTIHDDTADEHAETPAWAAPRGSAELTAYLDAADFSLLAAALESPR